ncbi:MAG: PDZ domain-containing protein [Thermoguttaceae bacterium]
MRTQRLDGRGGGRRFGTVPGLLTLTVISALVLVSGSATLGQEKKEPASPPSPAAASPAQPAEQGQPAQAGPAADRPRPAPPEGTSRPEGERRPGEENRNDQKNPAALGVAIAEVEGRPGLHVVEVVPGSPAEAAGIRAGDFLLSIDGTDLTGASQMIELTRQKKEGARVQIKLRRGGEEQTLEASLGASSQVFQEERAGQTGSGPQGPRDDNRWQDPGQMPPPPGPEFSDFGDEEVAWLGVILRDSRGEQQQQKGAVVARIYPSGPAARADLYPDDVIVRADGKDVTSPEDFARIVQGKKPSDKLEMTVQRDGEEVKVEATLAARNQFFPAPADEESFYRGQFGNGQQQEDEDCPTYAMMLEQERHSALQRQRIEDLVRELKNDVQALREEVRQLRGADSGREQAGAGNATQASSSNSGQSDRPAGANQSDAPRQNPQ